MRVWVRVAATSIAVGDPKDPANFPAYRARVAAFFVQRPRDEWVAMFDGPDDNVHPVLDLAEAPEHAVTSDRVLLALVAVWVATFVAAVYVA